MNVLYTVLICLTIVVSAPVPSHASTPDENNSSLLKIRSNDHDEFERIVLEGDEALIASGKVDKRGEEINVSFPGSDFTVRQSKKKIFYQKDNDALIFRVKNRGDIKVFSLDGPSRLVIDIYKKAQETKNERDHHLASEEKTRAIKTSFFSPSAAEASTIKEKDNVKTKEAGNDSSASKPVQMENDSGPVFPESLMSIWELLKKDNNPYRAMAQLSSSKPSDAAELAPYHFLYGEALYATGDYIGAIDRLRLAYVHAADRKMKEVSLFRRAEAYAKLGFYYEAKVNFQIFIADFPSSGYLQKAHLGLANSLSMTGSFAESVEHYEKAGRSPEVLFNMANALQKLEKVEEARRLYANAMTADSTYPEKWPETYFYLAENMRMSGRADDAKKLLMAIESGPFRDSALLSLGLIAMEERNFTDAVVYFESVVFTRNLKVKVNALFNISLAYLKQGKLKESIATLEDVRKKYIDSSMYDEALLVLSKLYRQQGRMRESVALLKELVYGNQPPKEAFTELEEILMEASERQEPVGEGEVRFIDLWREVGQWMLDASRADFLLRIAEVLRPERQYFVQLCSWLAVNAEGKPKMTAALEMAHYYAELHNLEAAAHYMNAAKDTGKEMKSRDVSDIMLRVEAKLSHAANNSGEALKSIMALTAFEGGDFRLLADIIKDIEQQGTNIKQAVAFFEKMIGKSEAGADDYVRLADILYDINEEKALGYYRVAYEKDPGNEWAAYRIGTIVDMPETGELYTRLEKGDSLISRVARTKMREINLLNRIDEVYQ